MAATIKRQKAIEIESKLGKYRMKMDAVPKKTPAATPSRRESLLVLAFILAPTCCSSVFSNNCGSSFD
jgi:hypothetical protein